MSKDNKFAESASEELKKEAWSKIKAGDENAPRVPSGNWTLGKIRNVSPNCVNRWCYNTIKHIAQTAKKTGLVKPGCTVAADATKIGYHGQNLRRNANVKARAEPQNSACRSSYIR